MSQRTRSQLLGVRERQRRAAADRRRVAVASIALKAGGLRVGAAVSWGENGTHEGLVIDISADGMCTVTETAVVGRRWHLPAMTLRRR